jgi:hypothetical protein
MRQPHGVSTINNNLAATAPPGRLYYRASFR